MSAGAKKPTRGWVPGQPITEEMHVAAVKVLYRAPGVGGLPQRMLDAMLAAARCSHCDGTGHVHGITGEWRGICTECDAGDIDAFRLATDALRLFGGGPHTVTCELDSKKPETLEGLQFLQSALLDAWRKGFNASRAEPAQKPIGFANAGQLSNMSGGYAYIYPEQAAGASVALYATPQAAPAPQVSEPTMQPIVKDSRGCLRFKSNGLVDALYQHGVKTGMGLNELYRMDFTNEDRQQFAQLIGYSLSGYGTLSYVTDEAIAEAERAAQPGALNAELPEPSYEESGDSENYRPAAGEPFDMTRVLDLADVHAEDSREDGTRLLDRGGLFAFAQDILRIFGRDEAPNPAAPKAAPGEPAHSDPIEAEYRKQIALRGKVTTREWFYAGALWAQAAPRPAQGGA